MSVFSMSGDHEPMVNADDLAAQVLARTLQRGSGKTHAVYRKGSDYLVKPYNPEHYPEGWTGVRIAWAHEDLGDSTEGDQP